MIDAHRLNRLQALDHEAFKFQRGIEREALRVDSQNQISQKAHPEALGAALTHPTITTDYSEALMEFITGVHSDTDALLDELDVLHRFTQQHLGDELLWAGSMPAVLPEQEQIPIAQYGDSHIGRLKTAYRHGLWHRYGRKMQTIAGLHYNWSLPDAFWQQWASSARYHGDLQHFKTNEYFGLIRSFRRHSWLLLYLFGASPAFDRSFLDTVPDRLSSLGEDTYYAPYATSLRMSDLGYSNRAQKELFVCFNSLHSYSETLLKAIKTPYPQYERIGLIDENGQPKQLNTSILQIENEYYSDIRPKRVAKSGEHPIQALRDRGVEYIEVRCLDVNPFEPLGVTKSQMNFVDLFLLWCLVQESPLIEPTECDLLRDNNERVAFAGRDPKLHIYYNGESKPIKSLAEQVMAQIYTFAETIDQHENCTRYREACTEQLAKIRDPNLTPSAKLLQKIEQHGSFSRALSQRSQSAKHQFQRLILPEAITLGMKEQASESVRQAQEIAANDQGSFEEFLKEYINIQ